MLTSNDIQRFRDQGFLVMENAYTASDIATVRSAIDRLVQGFDPEHHLSVFSTRDRDAGRDERFFRSAETVEYFLEEDALDDAGALRVPLPRAINKLGHALHDHVPEFTAFSRLPVLGDALRDLGLARPEIRQSMVIFKQPRIGGEVRWHQDASYLHTTPASVIGAWIALEEANRSNGCLLVQPGGHRSPLRERYRVDWETRSGRLETLDDTPWPDDDAGLALEVPAGALVLFHDHLPHASAANRSERSRLALTLHSAGADGAWSPDNWLQRPTLSPFRL